MLKNFAAISVLLGTALLALSPTPASAQSGMRIYGALSNFDCYNDTPDDCEAFEIEIENMHKEDVYHTWNYSAFGAPTVTTLGTGLYTSALVRYYSASAVVLPGHMTHFGVSLLRTPPPGTIHYRWLPKASSANPNPPPVPVELPQHQSLLDVNGIHDSLHNSSNNTIWVLPFGNRIHRQVELEELMTDNTVVTTAVPLGSGSDHLRPSKLAPGDTWVHDDPPATDDTQSDVMWFKVFEDVVTYDAHGRDIHAPGQQIATVMNSTIVGSSIPATPNRLYLADTQLTGSQWNQAMITLNGQAPANGAVVTLTSSSPFAVPPQSLMVPGGSDYAVFDIVTTPVPFPTVVTVTATMAGVSKSATFTILPPTLNQIWLSYSTAVSGTTFDGAVYLLGPAPVTGMMVKLEVDNPILTVPRAVFVPAGSSSAPFQVSSEHVEKAQIVTLSGWLNKRKVSTTVRLIP